MKAKGVIKWFDRKKGYGFIDTDEQNDVFVHYTNLKGVDLESLDEGDEVVFEIVKGEKGPRAEAVEAAK